MPNRVGSAIAAAFAALLSVTACSAKQSSAPDPRPSVVPTAYATTTEQPHPNRPNIIFVLTDDLSDNLVPQMPAVLSMEQHGASFSHYFVVDSLCCPSRSAIFTGEYPHDDRVFTNGGPLGGYQAFQANGDSRRCFAPALQRAGYTTAFMGKYLNGYEAADPVPPGWDVWDGVNRGGYGEFNYRMNSNGVPVQYGHTSGDYLTNVLAQKASSFISSAATQANPFFMEVSTFAPHDPYVPAPKYAKAARGALYPSTPAYDAQVRNPPAWLHQRKPLTPRQEAFMQRVYRLRVEDDYSVDDLITSIESSLKRTGLNNDTYLVFSSDNGYHMGEYRLLVGKQTAFDTDINVPLVVVGPHVHPGSTISGMASSIDLAPTFERLARARINRKTDGVSLLPILFRRRPPDWQRAILVEHHGGDDQPGDPDAQTLAQADPPSYEAIRTEGGLYVRYLDGESEFYNTKADPYELDNLGGRRAPRAMKVALHLLERCHDARQCHRAATMPFTGRA